MKSKILSAMMLLGAFETSAQGLNIHFSDNSPSLSFNLGEVRSLTYSGNVMYLNRYDGTTVFWDVGTISHFEHDDLITSDPETITMVESLQHSVHPNPSIGPVSIVFSIIAPSAVNIMIHDLQGRMVRNLHNAFHQSGPIVIAWDGTDEHRQPVPSGNYICRAIADGKTWSETIVIQR